MRIKVSTAANTTHHPEHLADRAAMAAMRATVSAKTDLSRINGGTISRADVAKFVVEQLTDDTWLRRAPLIIG